MGIPKRAPRRGHRQSARSGLGARWFPQGAGWFPGSVRGRQDEGAAAVEFALVATFVATLAFGTAAVISVEIDQPLQSLTSVLSVIGQPRG